MLPAALVAARTSCSVTVVFETSISFQETVSFSLSLFFKMETLQESYRIINQGRRVPTTRHWKSEITVVAEEERRALTRLSQVL